MTPKRGRQLLKNSGVLIYPGWDMKSAMMFDSFLKKKYPDKQLFLIEVDNIFTGSGYDPDQKALLQWALHPKSKRLVLVDTNEMFGNLMIQRVGKIDPRIIAKLNLDVAKLKKDQVEFLV